MKKARFSKNCIVGVLAILFVGVLPINAYANENPVTQEEVVDDIEYEEGEIYVSYERKKSYIKLEWDKIEGASNIMVHRKSGDSAYEHVGEVAGDATSFKDTNVNTTSEYEYRFDIIWNDGGIATVEGIKVEPLRTVGSIIGALAVGVFLAILKGRRKRRV